MSSDREHTVEAEALEEMTRNPDLVLTVVKEIVGKTKALGTIFDDDIRTLMDNRSG